jgi:CHAT domain-containing protein
LQVVSRGSSEAGRLKFLKSNPIIISSLLSLALRCQDQGLQRTAFEMVLKGKGSVIDAMSADKETILCSDDSALTSVWRLHAEVSSQIANLMIAACQNRRYSDDLVSVDALWHVRDSLETLVSNRCTQYHDQQLKSDPKIGDIASSLREDMVLWEYLKYVPYNFAPGTGGDRPPQAERYAAFTLNADGQYTMIDLGEAGPIDSLILGARRQIYADIGDIYSPGAADAERRLETITNQLCRKIINPLRSSVADKKVICVAPDGMLGLIPFEILRADDGSYLIEQYQFQYLTAGRQLTRMDQMAQPISRAMIVGDPDFDSTSSTVGFKPRFDVPAQGPAGTADMEQPPLRGQAGCLDRDFAPLWYGRSEALAIAGALRKGKGIRVAEYYGRDATEGLIKNVGMAPDILHLSTHGFYCPEADEMTDSLAVNPLLRSGLALAGANGVVKHKSDGSRFADDGILTAFEVSALNLTGTQLVTLSACETGVGEPSQEMGIYGLRSAFLAAGAQSLLVSLWPVPDREAADLMSKFYTYWLSSGTKAAALRRAELELLHQCRTEHGHGYPLLWGGFILVGNPN